MLFPGAVASAVNTQRYITLAFEPNDAKLIDTGIKSVDEGTKALVLVAVVDAKLEPAFDHLSTQLAPQLMEVYSCKRSLLVVVLR